jgi:hypothetical protein
MSGVPRDIAGERLVFSFIEEVNAVELATACR